MQLRPAWAKCRHLCSCACHASWSTPPAAAAAGNEHAFRLPNNTTGRPHNCCPLPSAPAVTALFPPPCGFVCRTCCRLCQANKSQSCLTLCGRQQHAAAAAKRVWSTHRWVCAVTTITTPCPHHAYRIDPHLILPSCTSFLHTGRAFTDFTPTE